MNTHRIDLSLQVCPLPDALDKLFATRQTIAVLLSGSVQRAAGPALGLEQLATRCQVTVLPRIGPDAPLPEIDAALAVVRRLKPDRLLAIGGGSTLDAAKALSVLGAEGDCRQIFLGKERLPGTKIPLVAVPTTAGSGAETSHAAILLDPQTGIKAGLRGALLQPEQVVIDAALYLHAPARVLAECGFDALTHAVETAVSKSANPAVRWQSAAAIRVLLDCLPQVVEKRCPWSMEQVALAAMHMGGNLANSSTCLPHRIQYALRAKIAASHASGLVMLYRGWLEIWRRQPGLTAMDELAASLGYVRDGLLDRIEDLKQRLGLQQRLGDHGVLEEHLPHIASAVTGAVEQDPLYVGPETIAEILRHSL